MVFKQGNLPIQSGGKSTFFHSYQDRWRPFASILGYESFPGTMTPNTSSARIVAKSLTPKSFVTWRLKKKPNQNPAWKTPEAERRPPAHWGVEDHMRLQLLWLGAYRLPLPSEPGDGRRYAPSQRSWRRIWDWPVY